MITLALVSAVLTTTTVPAAKPVTMVYKFDTDAPARYTMTASESQSQSIYGQTVETSSTTKTIESYTLIKLNDDGSLVFSETTESVSLDITDEDGHFTYDSTNPADESKSVDPRAAVDATKIGWATHLVINPQGGMLDIANHDEMMKKAGLIKDQEIRDLVIANIEDKTTRIENFNALTFLLPENPVEAGDSWVCPFDLGEEMSVSQTMTLNSVSKQHGRPMAHVSFTGNMHITMDPDMAGMIDVLSNRISGTLVFDIERGIVESYTAEMTLKVGSKSNATGTRDVNITSSAIISRERLDD